MKKLLTACACGAVLMSMLSAAPTVAAPGDVRTGVDAADLREALSLPSGVTAAVDGATEAWGISSTRLNDFPRRGSAGYVILSTGQARQLHDDIPGSRQPSTDLPGDDETTLVLDIEPTAESRCLKLDVAMATEELVHHYTPSTPSDRLSVRSSADPDVEHALHQGPQYIRQEGSAPKPVAFEVNRIDYWHRPGDVDDREVGNQGEVSWAPREASPFDHFTVVETVEVPLPAGEDHTVDVSVADEGNDLLDTAAMVGAVRLAPRCSDEPGLNTGLIFPDFAIVGDRGVGNTLTVDLDGSTPRIERYDEMVNGWYAGAGRGVELRFRWYQHKVSGGGTKCLSSDMRDWRPIPDADRQSFVPDASQKGFCLVALVTGKKDGWRTETYPSPNATSWNPTLPIGNGVFVKTELPGIETSRGDGYAGSADGPPAVGDTLVAKPRDFTPRQDTFTYQWLAGGATIAGATGPEFVVTDQQAAKALSVRVTAQRLNFNPRPATSLATEPVVPREMSVTPRPGISGSAVPGQTVTAVPGTWKPTVSSFAYQWSVDGQVLSTARSATFRVRTEDLGKSLTVAVTGSLAGFRPVTTVSDPVLVGAAPMPGATPLITGTARVGERLTASATDWQPTGSTLTYTWRAGTTVLQSGTSRTLVLPGAAAGRRVVVSVEGRKAGHETSTRTSASTAVVAKGALKAVKPRVTGRAKVGSTLRAAPGTWGPRGVRLRYQWYLNGKKVSKATRSTFRLSKSARGKRATVRVTGSMTGYTGAHRTSSKTAKIAK